VPSQMTQLHFAMDSLSHGRFQLRFGPVYID
jgi:hypothetical protein